MEDPSGSGSEVVVSSPAGAPKSKLDTLAKDDLIKFAKKQMSAMQKMKTTYADLEKEFEIFKQQSNASSNADESNLIQELTERMNVLLFEKAECQQSLLLSYKDLDRTKQLAKDELVMLQTQLDCLKEDHQRQIKELQNSMEESSRQHQQELAQLQKLLTDYNQVGPAEEVLPCLEGQLKSLVSEMQASRISGEGHQRDLALAQQEIENLREEVAQGSARHEEEMRALEEDCEMERERLLLLHDELTEQLALKDSYLQDVQEEDEEPVRGSGIAKMLELSGCSQGDSTLSEGEAAETSRLKAALEDLSAQNTMLQDELTLLRNLKGEFESELERTREEFQAEKEELEFKIDELLMTKESAPVEPVMTSDEPHPKVIPDCDRPKTGRELQATNAGNEQDVGQSLPSNAQGVEVAPSTAKDQMVFSSGDPKQETQELQKLNQEIQELQELRTQLEVLTKERNSAIAEFNNIREILQRLEKESGQRICPYDAMKEQGAEAVHKLHYKIEELSQEKSVLLKSIKEATQENIKKSLHDLELQLEASIIDIQPNVDCVVPPQVSVEGQTLLVGELTKQNEAILVQLQAKENEVQELGEIVSDLTTKRDAMQSQLQRHEEQLDMFYAERTKESQRLQDEKENELASLGQEMERKLQSLGKEKDAEIEHLREEKAKMEAALKEEARERQETVSSLEVTVRDFSAERDKLEDKLKEASFELSHVQEERNSFASKLTTYQIELDQDKCALEARLHSLTEGVEQSRDTIRVLKESNAEAAKHSAERVLDLETRIEELEREKSMLLSKIEDASEEKRLKDSWEELQVHVEDLEKERNMLRCNLEEVLRDTEQLQKDLEDMKYANEKMREENQKLYAHISEEEKGDGNTAMEDLEKQKRQLEEQLEERNCLVTKLCSDIAALQESDARSTSCEENVASQLTEQIALLEKDAKLKNEKMNKIKAVAVKAKKELDTSKKEVTNLKEEVESLKAERERVSSSMKDVIHAAESYKNLQMDYDGLTEQLDKEREVVEVGERHVAELTKQLSAAVSQKELLVSEKEDLLTAMVTLRSTVKQLEAYVKDISKHREGLEADLLAERTMKEHKVKELLSATKELEEMTAELGKLHKRSQQTSQEMEQLRKEAQQNSLLGMEMADYERLVKELNTKVSQGESSVAQLKELICTHVQSEDSLKQEIEALKSQMDQREEKASKMKQLLVKTKKDLAAAKKQNASNVMLQASLKGELENNQQQLEGCKIEVSELMAERHRLQEQLRCVTEQHQRAASALQQRISSLQREGEISKAELVSTTREFESYKVRVHNVLKQQKNKSSMQSEGEAGTMEREQLCSQVEQLRTRLVENQRTLQSSTAELQQLQSEHDTLLERHNKILQETVTKEAQLRERLLSVQSENISLRTEQAQTQAELQSQAEAQRMAFREQVRSLQDEHGSTVETLHGQLRRLEEQLFTLQSGSLSIQSTRRPQVSDLQRRNPDPGQGGPGCIDLQSTAREEGEGMETTETERCVPAHPPLPSLEHLLHSPDPKQEPFVWTVEPTKEELSQKLTTAARSMEHMNSLLHETEATNAVLMEQVTLLKSEVRRLERNQEREKSVSNMEYLKNVLLQFIFLRSGNERQALLPVMHTMLQLSPEEKSKLAAIAQGEEDVSASRGAGWTSYLHSWSGIR